MPPESQGARGMQGTAGVHLVKGHNVLRRMEASLSQGSGAVEFFLLAGKNVLGLMGGSPA